MIKAKATGKGALQRLLKPPGFRAALLGALNQTVQEAAAILREETPKSSGRTAEAWHAKLADHHGAMIAAVVNAHRENGYLVAAGIEYGTPAHIIRPKHGKALAFGADRSSRAEGRVLGGQARQLNPVRAQANMSGRLGPKGLMGNRGIKSPIRYGNYLRMPNGRLRPIVASDVRTGAPLFRNSRGALFGAHGQRLVIVSLVRHPGTRPNPVVRRNLGVLRELFRANVTAAVREKLARP